MTRASAALPGMFRNRPNGLTRIERYVATRTLGSVAMALGVIAILILLINFVDVSRNVGGKSAASTLEVLWLTILKSPNVILLLLPFAFLFGVLGAFVGLNRRSELTAMRAAGVSAWRFIFPAAATAFLCGILTTALLNPAATQLNVRYETERANYMRDYLPGAGPKDVWLREGHG